MQLKADYGDTLQCHKYREVIRNLPGKHKKQHAAFLNATVQPPALYL